MHIQHNEYHEHGAPLSSEMFYFKPCDRFHSNDEKFKPGSSVRTKFGRLDKSASCHLPKKVLLPTGFDNKPPPMTCLGFHQRAIGGGFQVIARARQSAAYPPFSGSQITHIDRWRPMFPHSPSPI